MKDQKGFSLIEVMIAVALLSIVAIAFLSGLTTVINGVIKADGMATAEALAKSEIEYIKTISYTNAPWSYQLPGTPPSWDPTHALPSGYTSYNLSANATSLAGQGNNVQQISVTVTRGTQPWSSANFTITDYKVNR